MRPIGRTLAPRLVRLLVLPLLLSLHRQAEGAKNSPSAGHAFTVELLDPPPTVVPGKAVVDYRIRAIEGADGNQGTVSVSVDGRVLAYQSLKQCLSAPCWLPLSRYPLATYSGEHVLEVQVVRRAAVPPHAVQPLSKTARHNYTIVRSDLDGQTSDKFIKI